MVIRITCSSDSKGKQAGSLSLKTCFRDNTTSMMEKKTLVVLLLTIFYMAAVFACPRKCDCKSFNNGTTIVHCRYQSMDSVPLDFSTDTAEIDFGYNNISEISSSTFRHLPVLGKLVLDNCNIRTLKNRAFASLPALNELILRDNSISNVDSFAFEGIPRLRILNLENNNIRSLPGLLFENMNLRELVIRSNGLTHLPLETFDKTQVEVLDMGYNHFQEIPTETLKPLRNSLKTLILTDNSQALTLPMDIFSGFSFNELNLYGNQMEDSSFLQHVSASVLNVGGNRFGKLGFRQYASLQSTEEFHIQNSDISSLDPSAFTNFNNLKVLDLSRNKISSIDGEVFKHVPLLRKLDLGYNQLKVLPSNFGKFLSHLPELILTKNALATLDKKSFSGMNLTKLDLRYNLLQVIPESMGPIFDGIRHLSLGENPLHCNCEMRWFRLWLEKSRLFTGADHCYSPDYEYIWNRLPADFTCNPPEIYFVTENSTVLEGQDQMLTCVARGDPAPEMEWISPDGRSLTHINPNMNRTNHKTFVSMKIQNMQKYQSGIYRCVAHSLVANTSVAVYLSITDELPPATSPPTTSQSIPTTIETTAETTATTTSVPTTLGQTATSSMDSDKTTTGLNRTNNFTDGPQPASVDHKGTKMGGAFVAIIIVVLISCIVVVVVIVVIGVVMRQRKYVREYDVSSGKLKILDTTDGDLSKEPLDLNETQPKKKKVPTATLR